MSAGGKSTPLSLLPSARFHPGENELPAAALELADEDTQGGDPEGAGNRRTLRAQSLGAKVPGRLVTSAKSWLSHPDVNRTAPILPWAPRPRSAKTSPVDASASYLRHVRLAWDAAHPQSARRQEVVLTVPASFDEAARALTVEAAHSAGLPRVRLLEEPQAAF